MALTFSGLLSAFGPGENVNHRGPWTKRRLELLQGRDFDDANADRAERGVVDIARVRGDDRFVLRETGQVRKTHVQIRTAAGDAGGRRQRQPGRASIRHEPPLGAGECREPRAHRFRELVEMHVLLSRLVHRHADLRQHRRAADDRECAARVDERADADRLIDVRPEPERVRACRPGGRRRGGGLRRGFQETRESQHAAQHSPTAEQLTASDDGIAHRAILLLVVSCSAISYQLSAVSCQLGALS